MYDTFKSNDKHTKVDLKLNKAISEVNKSPGDTSPGQLRELGGQLC